MMTTAVFRDGHDFFVSLNLAGEEVDTAGPFDDRLDAELAAQRMAPPAFDFEYDNSGPEISWSGGRYLSKRERKLAERKLGAA